MKLRGDDLVWQEVGEGVVVLDLRASKYFRLNGSGAQLWRMLAEGTTKQLMTDELVRLYDIGIDRASEDMERFLENVTEMGFLERDEESVD